jgi:hypothetical protein
VPALGYSSRQLQPVVMPDLPDQLTLTREGVWRIASVAAGLQVIAGTIGSLPLRRSDSQNRPITVGLLTQLDPTEPTPATLTRVVEDLVLFPAAFLVVLQRYADGFPRHLRYVPFEEVREPTPDDPLVYVCDGTEVGYNDVIRIPSHWPGLLAVGGRVLRTTLQLESAANRLAATDTPAGILKNRGPDLSPEEVDALLGAWEAGRARRLTGYVNAVLDYERVQFSAGDMELNAGRDHQVAEVARLLNLPTSDLNAPTNDSLTYSTVEGQRLDRLNRLRPYLVAVESRFSMPDVTPRGQRTFFDVADYLRADTTARMAAYEVAIRSQVLTPAEARQRENLPPATTPALPPGEAQP